jgi:hypothetical protein
MVIPDWFCRMLKLDSRRYDILINELSLRSLTYKEVSLAGTRHLLVYPAHARQDKKNRQKLITAHYDRVPGTPGALDNSAALWQLMDYASGSADKENIIIAFTDREEISGNAADQGAFLLGKALSRLGIDAPVIFCLDVTGRGDTIVVADTVQQVLESYPPLRALQQQVSLLSKVLVSAVSDEVRCVSGHLPFGENLGFMLSGLPAIELSLLPETEAYALRRDSGHGHTAVPHGTTATVPTWSYLHTAADTADLLEPAAFFIMQKVLERIGLMRFPKR